MTAGDTTVERASRWVAARSTRRSFLGRVAQLAVVVAGGPTLVGMMARSAEARVCGQSGVSPKCATFDCAGPGRVWGWCWYASPGCCAGGGLKKICDCCTFNYPNVHGYCPSGHNVECIVESCWADPRVMPVPTRRLRRDDAVGLAAIVSATQFGAGRGGWVVLSDSSNPVHTAVASTVSAALRGPLLLTKPDHLSSYVLSELDRLDCRQVAVVGPSLGSAVTGPLQRRGIRVDRIGAGTDLTSWSLSVAKFVTSRTGAHRAVCSSTSHLTVALAGAAATARRYPLTIGGTAAQALARDERRISLTYMVGGEMAARAGSVPGGHPVAAGSLGSLARAVASVVTEIEHRRGLTLAAVPVGHRGAAAAMTGSRGVILYHDPLVLDAANANWIRAHQTYFARGFAAGATGGLSDSGYYGLQSALNHFDTHRLIGVSGQGLPVISQPFGERDLGRARVAGQPPEEEHGGYWVSRANPNR